MTDQTMQQSDGLVSLPLIQTLADVYKMSAKAFAFTFRSVAMPQPHTEAEFVSCCIVAREHGLNPLTKEIYFMRDKHGKIQAIVGLDGWIKKLNEHPQFDGVAFTDHPGKDGSIAAITCRIYRKDRSRPTEITEYFDECVQKRDKKGPWDTHPKRMLRNRTLNQCTRIAIGFAGVMDRDEFEQWQALKDVTPSVPAVASDPPDPDNQPDTTTSDIPDLPQEQSDEIADASGVLKKLRDDLGECSNDAERMEVWEGMSELIWRLSEADQSEAEKIFKQT